jgi:hypothetical protein
MRSDVAKKGFGRLDGHDGKYNSTHCKPGITEFNADSVSHVERTRLLLFSSSYIGRSVFIRILKWLEHCQTSQRDHKANV